MGFSLWSNACNSICGLALNLGLTIVDRKQSIQTHRYVDEL